MANDNRPNLEVGSHAIGSGYCAPVCVAVCAGADFFATFLTAAFFAGFLVAAFSCCALAALTASHRFFVAALIAFLPAAESFRLGLGAASGTDGSAAFLDAAHLLRCASPMRFRAAALSFRRLGVAGSAAAAGSVEPPVSQARRDR